MLKLAYKSEDRGGSIGNFSLIAPFPDHCLLVPPNQCYVSQTNDAYNVMFNSLMIINKKVEVGKDQEKAQSEKYSHSKNQGG